MQAPGDRSTEVRARRGLLLALATATSALAGGQAHERLECLKIRSALTAGWSTWDSRSVLAQALLPECLSVALAFKQVRWLLEASFTGCSPGIAGGCVAGSTTGFCRTARTGR